SDPNGFRWAIRRRTEKLKKMKTGIIDSRKNRICREGRYGFVCMRIKHLFDPAIIQKNLLQDLLLCFRLDVAVEIGNGGFQRDIVDETGIAVDDRDEQGLGRNILPDGTVLLTRFDEWCQISHDAALALQIFADVRQRRGLE